MTQTPPKPGRTSATNGNSTGRYGADDLAASMSRRSMSLPPTLVDNSPRRVPERSLSQPSLLSALPQPEGAGMKAFNVRGLGQTLRGRLLWTLLPAATVPLVLLGLVAGQVQHRQQEADLAERVEKHSVLASEVFNNVIQTALATTQSIADNPLVIDAAIAGTQFASEEGLPSHPINLPDIAQLDEQFGETNLLRPNPTLNRYLEQIVTSSGFAEVFFTERNGYNVAYSNITGDFVQSDESWWQEGWTNLQAVGNAEFDESAQTFSIDLAQAITDPETGDVVGVMKAVVADTAFGSVADFVTEQGFEETTQVQLIDTQSGALLFSVTADGVGGGSQDLNDVVGGRAILDIAAFIRDAELQGLTEAQLAQGLSERFSVSELKIGEFNEFASLHGEGAVSRAEHFDVSFVYQDRFYSIVSPQQADIVAIASIDHNELQATGRDQQRNFLLAAAGLAAVLGGTIWWLSGRLASPLNSLADTAQTVAAGNLDVLARPSGTAETRTLADNFNALVVRVKGLLREQEMENRRTQLFAAVANARTPEELTTPLNQLMDEIRQTMKADRVVVYRFRPDWSGYIAGEAVLPGMPRAMAERIEDACIDQETIEAYRMGRVLPTQNVFEAGFHPDHLRFLKRLDVKSNLVVPIRQGDQLFGLLATHHCRDFHTWQSAESEYASQLADRLGQAISGIGTIEHREQEAEQQRLQKEALQRELVNLLSDVEGASGGDLTVRAEVSAGEIGIVADFFNAIVGNLRDIVVKVKQSANQVTNSVGQNEGSIRTLAEDALNQAQEITRTLDSVQTMTASIQEVADNAREAAAVSALASKTAAEGDEAMDRTVDSIMTLRETVAETAKKVKRLGEASQRISKVVMLINEIALKTNLLAVNASIEAARAGAEGQGFAVVAEQVGALADQSATATKEIEQIVEAIQLETGEVVDAMETGTSQVVEGTKLVENAKTSLGRIREVSRQIDKLLQSISSATVSQAETSQAVSALMEAIAQTSKATSQSSSQVSESLQETVQISEELASVVGTFRVGDEASSSS